MSTALPGAARILGRRKGKIGSLLCAAFICSINGSHALDQQSYQEYLVIREQVIDEVCGDDPAAREMAQD